MILPSVPSDPIQDPIRDPIQVPKWIGWMDGLSKHLKIRLLTSDFCIVTPGLFFLFFEIANHRLRFNISACCCPSLGTT